MRLSWGVLRVAAVVALLGCRSLGGGDPGARCTLHVVGVEGWKLATGALDASYRVSGVAGSPGMVWLSARVGESRFLSGGGVDVGPGPFQAVVDLKLTGIPRAMYAVLEVRAPGRARPARCKAKAPIPSS